MLSNTQYGFRTECGTRDCLAILSTDIQTSCERKQQTLCAFLYISGAYDNVFKDIFCEQLYHAQIPQEIIRVFWGLFWKNLFFNLIMHPLPAQLALKDFRKARFSARSHTVFIRQKLTCIFPKNVACYECWQFTHQVYIWILCDHVSRRHVIPWIHFSTTFYCQNDCNIFSSSSY
jgi:hypothetical protein